MKKSNLAYFGILTVVFVAIYVYIFDVKLDLGGDNANYLILGHSISTGHGYTDLHVVGHPPANHFPPGYPAVLAFFMLFSENFTFLKIINGLFLLGTTWLMFLLLQKFVSDKRLALTASVLMLFNLHLLTYSTILMSEVPYLFFSTLAVYLFVGLHEDPQFYKRPSFYAFIALAVFSYHIRTAGIALIAGIGLYLLLKKNWKFLLSFIVGFVALSLPWLLRGKAIGGNSYLHQLIQVNPYRPEDGIMGVQDWGVRFMANVSRYVGKEFPSAIFPMNIPDYKGDTPMSMYVLGFVIIATMIFGLIKLEKYRLLLIGYIAGSFAILLLWPQVWFGTRFVLPLIPFILFLLIAGVWNLLGMINKQMGLKISPFILLAFCLIFIGDLKALHEKSKAKIVQKYQNYFDAGEYVRNNTPENAVVATRKLAMFYLYARRSTTMFAKSLDYNEVLKGLDDKGVTHVVIDQLGYADVGRYLLPVVQANPEKFVVKNITPAPETYTLEYHGNVGYFGEWSEDMDPKTNLKFKEGKGEYHSPNGFIFAGSWKRNKREGTGVLSLPDGRKIAGTWSNDVLVGEAVMTNAQGEEILRGNYTEEQFVSNNI